MNDFESQLMFEGLNKKSHFSRKDWISACHFHPHSTQEVFDEITHRVKQSPKPLVLLDLDSTLYEVAPRTHQILKEWSQHHPKEDFSEIQQAIHTLEKHQIGFSIQDTLEALGIAQNQHFQEALESARDFWAARFFRNSYLTYDHAYPGAAEFVQNLHRLGAEIVYLTGRDEPGMGEGTRANLLRDGFPWEVSRTRLLMKPNSGMKDLDYKLDAARSLLHQGDLITSFENEPPNLAALWEIFPEAMHVFVDTVCSTHPAPPRQGLYRIQSFKSI